MECSIAELGVHLMCYKDSGINIHTSDVAVFFVFLVVACVPLGLTVDKDTYTY